MEDISFSLEALNELPSIKEQKRYLNNTLKKIGNGSSRLVYRLNDETVLKFAKNENGIEQNEEEYSKSLSNTPIFAKVYDSDEDGKWIIMEYGEPIKNIRVKQIYGVKFENISDFISLAFNDISSREKILIDVEPSSLKMYKDYIKWINNESTNSIKFTDKLGFFLKAICDYIKNNRSRKCDVMDWFAADNWGIANRNGEECLVIIDMGLNENLY